MEVSNEPQELDQEIVKRQKAPAKRASGGKRGVATE
jgi:hypothetical protein